MKKGALLGWLGILLCAIAALFYHIEWKYSLPTPVPANYHAVATGQPINLSGKIAFHDKPVFLHFFNPDCPCSRFNIEHFKSLVKQYSAQVDFNIVVLSAEKDYSASDIQHKFGLDIPVSFDSTIARTCGVYSTPQAVIINGDHRLYYRGNYNRSRYCTDKNSNYAQIALDSLLNQSQKPAFSALALRAYGCQLPNCTK